MFGLFSKKNRCLGVDFGTAGVKIVELKKENNLPVFVNYAIYSDAGTDSTLESLKSTDIQEKEMLAEVLARGNFETKNAVIGIPGFYSLIFFIELPEMPSAEIEQAVKFEAAKYIPTSVEEVGLGWEIVGSSQEKSIDGGQSAGRGHKIQVMVVSVPKKTVSKYGNLANAVHLDPLAIEVENFAVARALVGNDKGSFMIVNIGAKATDFTIVSDGVVRVTRNIDKGGNEISKALTGGLGIDLARAERMKKEGQLNLLDPQNDMARLVRPVLGIISDEIKRLTDTYHNKNFGKRLEKIIITGGGSKMKSLSEYFTKETGIGCQAGNALARIGISKKHIDVLEKAAPELTVAIGLAMRGIENV